MRVLLIDNYDSFVSNLAHYLGEAVGEAPTLIRNDQWDWPRIRDAGFDAIVISPGPGRPERDADIGVSREVLLHAQIPVLGVCLGHQAIVHVNHGQVVHAPWPMHGRSSLIEHDGEGLFDGLPSPLDVVRYHSLLAAEPLPPALRVTARSSDGLIMALEHRTRPQWGVQFHPESINTEFGRQLIRNFIELARRHRVDRPSPAVDLPEVAASRMCIPQPRSVFWRRIDTPTDSDSVFMACFADSPRAFWLDSSAVRQGYSRFSFMGDGGEAGQTLQHRVGTTPDDADEVFARIREGLAVTLEGGEALPFDFIGGWVGYFGYELKALTELPGAHRSTLPDMMLRYVERFLAYDHVEHCWYAVCVLPPAEQTQAQHWLDAIELQVRAAAVADTPAHAGRDSAVDFVLERDRTAYAEAIASALAAIGDGESYELCLTQRIRARAALDTLDLYRHLRRSNPAPYAALLRCGEFNVISSSPERFLRLSPNGVVEIKPIKGTRARLADPDDDLAVAQGLRECEKDRAENLMIVDLTRNDLSRVCEIGSIWVPKLMHVESYASVHQLVSTVRGHLHRDADAVDLLRATFPGGSMTGAPKRRTLQLIDTLEDSPRGVYSGALGYLSWNGSADLSMVIRTIVQQDDALELGVGGAIIALSDADEEFDEILVKARALLRAIASCASGDADAWTLDGVASVEVAAGTAGLPLSTPTVAAACGALV